MYAILPSSVITPGYTGTPQLATSPGWDNRHPQGASSERRRVTIYRDNLDAPWGFRLQGGKDLNAPLSVKRVFSGSPADGRLTRDDLILAIDDQTVDDLSSAQVLEAIKSAGGSLVLTIETSPYDSAFDGNFESLRKPVHHEKPVQHTEPSKHETKTSDYDSFQSSPSVGYETSPPEYNRPAASAYYSKVTRPIQSRHRPPNRFQATQTVPHGLSEPGWSPRAKPVAKEPPTVTTREPPTAVTEPPASQHRSARQQAEPRGSSDTGWRSQYATVEDSNVPAWYGSLRSTRAAHPCEVRAARTQSPTYEDALYNVPTEPRVSQQNTWAEPEPTQSQQSRTYKAEIHGLMLARPSYHQAQSTPEWEDASGREQDYRTSGQARSAPETPNADVCGRTICSDAQIADYSQQVDGSVPVKIQPSALFGNRSAIRAVQSPTQTRVSLRAQPQELKVTSPVGQPREETRDPGVQFVSAPKVQQTVSASRAFAAPQAQTLREIAPAQARIETARNVSQPTPVTVAKPTVELVKAPQRVPALQTGSAPLAGTLERFNPVPDRPHKENLLQAQKVNLSSVIERFNPTPDRPEKQTKISASESLVKFTEMPLERFNPTPDKGDKLTNSPVSHSQVNPPSTTLERFNPTPDKQEGSAKLAVTHSPPKLPSASVESVSQQPARLTKSTISPARVKFSQTPLERFNPTPDRPENIVEAKATHTSENSLQTPLERFNPTPDRPLKVPQRKIERFNPVPDRP